MDYLMSYANAVIDTLGKGWISSLIGILGIIIGIIYAKVPREAKPVYKSKCLNLIGKDNSLMPDEVQIFYGDTKVDKLNKTYVVFWNNGKKTIYGENIVKDDRLRLVFGKETSILSARVLISTREVNKFTLEKSPNCDNELYCDFDFLDPKDGVTIEVLHAPNKVVIKPSTSNQISVQNLEASIIGGTVYGQINIPRKNNKKYVRKTQMVEIRGTIKGLPQGVKELIPVFDKYKQMSLIFQTFLLGLIMSALVSINDRNKPISKYAISIAIITLIVLVLQTINNKGSYPKKLKVDGIDI